MCRPALACRRATGASVCFGSRACLGPHRAEPGRRNVLTRTAPSPSRGGARGRARRVRTGNEGSRPAPAAACSRSLPTVMVRTVHLLRSFQGLTREHELAGPNIALPWSRRCSPSVSTSARKFFIAVLARRRCPCPWWFAGPLFSDFIRAGRFSGADEVKPRPPVPAPAADSCFFHRPGRSSSSGSTADESFSSRSMRGVGSTRRTTAPATWARRPL